MLPPRGSDRPRRRRPPGRRARPASLALALVLVAGLTVSGVAVPAAALPRPASPPGATAPGATPATAPGAAPAAAPGAAVESYEITLVTGDRVELTVDAQQRYGVTVHPAPRPGGETPLHLTQIGPDGVYVLPDDAVPLIQTGRLDRELFNVAYLAEHGFADGDTDTLPLIVSYSEPTGAASRGFAPDPDALAARAAGLPAAAGAVGLASINGAGVALAKEGAGQFWHRLRGAAGGTGRAANPAGVARVWLDRVAEPVLDQSVPLVGAPQAWEAGYDGTGSTVAVLDTGVDLTHPDLAGQVSVAESFVDGEPADDVHGHGTHVASTIAGTGAAAGGRYAGVAPGAELLSGRVCDSSGECPYSAMIAGMEWAASEMEADVVSMSLGGPPSDGTDPLSQAVNNLTASTGALFVIAAGNFAGHHTVTSPATADASLAVAATDNNDDLAWFSSRGPRYWDLAMKPDLAAPGVDITAARAAGTGNPEDGWYTVASGTSMATPHVSGAAAILAQRHPDWQADQLKAALMSTAVDAGHDVYGQGAGRLDVARAASQQVFAGTPNLDFGIVELPRAGQPEQPPITRQVSYTNRSDQPVTLHLTPTLARTDGGPVPAGALSTDPTVTVPAGGSATVDVTLDLAGLDAGWYSGAVVGTDAAGGARVTTPVGLVRETAKVDLTIRTLGPGGQPLEVGSTFMLDVAGDGGPVTEFRPAGVGVTEARVPPGTYSIGQVAGWTGADSRPNAAWLLEPELTLDQDTELILDARTAVPVSFDTPQPSEPLSNNTESFLQRTAGNGQVWISFFQGPAWTHLWATPTEQVSHGELRFASQWTLGEPGVEMSVREPAARTLHPATPMNFLVDDGWSHAGFPDYRPFDRPQDLPVVDAGRGTPEELAGRDLTGAAALVEVELAEDPFGPICGLDIRVVEAVRAAGAAALVGFPSADTDCPIPMTLVNDGRDTFPPIGIRHAYLPTAEGLELRQQLAAGPVTVRVDGTPQTGHTNVLKPYEDGRIPESLHYDLTGGDQLARFDLAFHAAGPSKIYETRYVWREGDQVVLPSVVGFGPTSIGPDTRREYVGPVGPGTYHLREAWYGEVFPDPNDRQRVGDLLEEPVRVRERWFAEPQTPGPAVASDAAYDRVDPEAPQPTWAAVGQPYCSLCWEGDMLTGMSYLVTGGPADQEHDNHRNTFLEDTDYRLYRDGEQVPVTPMGAILPTFELPDGTADYRLEFEGPQTETSWRFRSGPPVEAADQLGYLCFGRDYLQRHDGPCGPVPAVFVSYDLGDGLAMDNTVVAPGGQWLDVHAYHHPSPYPTPEIAGLRLWTSYDQQEWTPARVRPAGDGRFEVRLLHPPGRHRGSDQVSLKVDAWDVAGNRVEQVTRDAFTLADRMPAPGGAH